MATEKHGIVYISTEPEGFDSPYSYGGYWDSGVEPYEVLEHGPGWNDPEEAVKWGRERAPKVVLRIGTQIYNAGEVDAVGDDDVIRWESRGNA